MSRLLAGLLLLPACFNPQLQNGVPCSVDRECPEGQVCAIDDRCYDPDQLPDFDAGPECAAGETVCTSDVVVECDAEGNVLASTDCPLGCHDSEARCNRLDPSNGLAPFLDDAAGGPEVSLSDGAMINTTTGEVVNGDGSPVTVPSTVIPAPQGGVAVRVVSVSRATFHDVTVSGVNALALVSEGDVEFLGNFDIRPGTGTLSFQECGGAIPTSIAGTRPGLGGGGFGSAGGSGGAGAGGAGQPGGSVNGNDALIPLRGGCSAYRHCTPPDGSTFCMCTGAEAVEAIGGGAVQVSSNGQIRVGSATETGTIQSQGGAAITGCFSNHGLGGGSGGAILFEAGEVDILGGGLLVAHGGGGSCLATSGQEGRLDGAPNGASCSPSEGDGGAGATAVRVASAGQDSPDGFGGGGGGGVGRIRINAGALQDSGGSSPTPSIGTPSVR